jgi:hypothetical protein
MRNKIKATVSRVNKITDGHHAPVKKVDKNIIENHKQAAAHHMEAAKHHLDAAKHHEGGNYEKAAYSKLLALGHHIIAGEYLSDDAKHHVQIQKQANYHF